MKVCGDTELAGEKSRGTWFDSKICYCTKPNGYEAPLEKISNI